MKPILSAVLFCTLIATPAAAQDYYGSPRAGAYDGYNGYDRRTDRCLSRAIQFLRPKAS